MSGLILSQSIYDHWHLTLGFFLFFYFLWGWGSPKISNLWHLQVGPGLGPSCLQKLSADNTSRQRASGL